MHTKLLIIGSGPAGYSAAIYAARANLKPILVSGIDKGGQLMVTTDVENYPGFESTIQGPWLMEQMEKQALNVGTSIIPGDILEVDFSKKPFVAKGENETYTADSVIIATGARAKWLGIESEEKFRGYGVSGCATCDGFFFKNKIVAVVGGGNTAVEEALYLTNHASKVFILHRRDSFKAEKVLQDRLFANKKIEILWNSVVDEVIGTDNPKSVTALKIKSTIDNRIKEIELDGVFIAIGHTPNTAIFQKWIEVDEDGYIKTIPGSTKTNIAGIFAAGDVQDKIYRQAVTSAGTGCMAALDAEKYLSIQE